MTLGTMMGLNALAGALLVPLSNLVSTASQLQLLGSYVERIDDVFDTPPERPRDQQGQTLALIAQQSQSLTRPKRKTRPVHRFDHAFRREEVGLKVSEFQKHGRLGQQFIHIKNRPRRAPGRPP